MSNNWCAYPCRKAACSFRVGEWRSQADFQAFLDESAVAKDTGSAALALAILAAFCRLPELAQSSEVVESIPLFVKARAETTLPRVVRVLQLW